MELSLTQPPNLEQIEEASLKLLFSYTLPPIGSNAGRGYFYALISIPKISCFAPL